MKVYSHNPYSEGAKALSQALGIKRIKHEGSRYRPKASHIVINWGATNLPDFSPARVLNEPSAIVDVSDKLRFFRLMSSVGYAGNPVCPPFTTDKEEALSWLAKGSSVVCRTVLNGSSGKGIVIAEEERGLVEAPLYVRYVPKKEEYRVHVFNGEVIDVQRKARRLDEDNPNWQIRNLEGGFVFQRHNLEVPERLKEIAIETMKHTQLVFGAVDVIYSAKRDRFYVLEINSAPGLQGETVNSYANAFRRLM